MTETEERILDVAMTVLGQSPDAGIADIARAAGVVRRTVYGYFPSRLDLVRALTRRAVLEIGTVLAEVDASGAPAEEAWVHFVARLWPLSQRYRVLVVLRRGEYGADIHALLGPIEEALTELVRRGQDVGTFGSHLSGGVLAQLAWSAVFTIADSAAVFGTTPDVSAATMTTLLMLGVPEDRAKALLAERPNKTTTIPARYGA